MIGRKGELDITATHHLGHVLHTLLDGEATALTVDLTDVPFLDSTALSVLVSVQRRLHQTGAGLVLITPHERLLRIFRMTALDRVFTIVAAASPATDDARRAPHDRTT